MHKYTNWALLNAFSPKRIANSFGYAFKGLRYVASYERNFQVHIVAFLVVVGTGLAVKLSRTEWCLVLICIAMVMAAECFNTALELLTDLVSPNQNPQAGKAKDVAAAAVTICAMGAVVVGIIVFLPHLYHIFCLP